MDGQTQAALDDFVSQLVKTDEVEAVWVAGSLATGDHVPNVSDMDHRRHGDMAARADLPR